MTNKVYRVAAPDGSVLRIEGPENASEDQLISVAQQHYKRQVATPRGLPPEPLINARALGETLQDTPRYLGNAINSFATGVGDIATGAGQLASKVVPDSILRPMSRAADYLTGGTGEVSGPMDQFYAQAMREREKGYQRSRDNPELPDVGRLTGSVVAGGLLGGGGTAAATLPGRMAQGAKVGGLLGSASIVDPGREKNLTGLIAGEGQQPDYWTQKAVQVGGGAALGAAAPAIVEGVIRGAGAAVNALANVGRGLSKTATGQASAEVIEGTLTQEMGRQGVKWSELPDALRSSLVSEVQKSLKSGGAIDPEAIRRTADFARLKIQPTQGQVTRDPLQFAREQNYAKTGIGKPIADRLTDQNAQLIGTLDTARGAVGAKGADSYAAGQNVIAGLQARDAARKGVVDAAYGEARSLAGIESDVPAQPVAQRIGRLIEDFGEDRIPSAVMNRIKSFGMLGGEQTRVFNIREAEQLKTLIGNNIENPNTPTGKALTLLKNSIDDAVNSIGDDAGAQAAGAFRQARGLAAQRFGAIDSSPAMAKAISREAVPEKFIEQNIIRGSIDDVANNLRQIRPQDRAEVRASVLDWVRSKSVTGVEDTAKFTQSGYNEALRAIGPRKLELIFAGDRQALEQLRALGRVGAYVQAPPVASGVNYSSSGTTGIDFLDQLTRLPVAGLLGKPGDAIRAAQAARAVGPVSPTQAPLGLLGPATIDRAANAGGLLSVPMASQAPALFMGDNDRRRLKTVRAREVSIAP